MDPFDRIERQCTGSFCAKNPYFQCKMAVQQTSTPLNLKRKPFVSPSKDPFSQMKCSPKKALPKLASKADDSGFVEFSQFWDDHSLKSESPSDIPLPATPLNFARHVRHSHDSVNYSPIVFNQPFRKNLISEETGIQMDDVCQTINNSMYSIDLGESSLVSDKTNDGCDKFLFHNISSIDSSKFSRVLQQFSPIVPDRLIGRSIGTKHVDIVCELFSRNVDSSLILSHLDALDLCRFCQVSNQWKDICEKNMLANKRKQDYVRMQRLSGKENWKRRLKGKHLTTSKGALATVQSTEPHKQSRIPFPPEITFTKAVESLKNEERLCHCPKCHSASKVTPVEYRGLCLKCSYNFCARCFTPYHDALPCVPVTLKKVKTDHIGGKKSKKTLRRL